MFIRPHILQKFSTFFIRTTRGSEYKRDMRIKLKNRWGCKQPDKKRVNTFLRMCELGRVLDIFQKPKKLPIILSFILISLIYSLP